MVKIVEVALAALMLVVATAPGASAEWIHSDWKWSCAGAGSTNQHRYWITSGENPQSGRVRAKRITMTVSLGGGERRTQVCENIDQCEWTAQEFTGGCVKSCSRAEVVFADNSVNATQEQCAK